MVHPAKNSAHVIYGQVATSNEIFDAFEQQVESFQDKLHEVFPSVYACLRWLDKFDCAVADNKFAYFGVTVKDNDVAFWVTPKQVTKLQEPIRDKWISMIGNNFKTVGESVSR